MAPGEERIAAQVLPAGARPARGAAGAPAFPPLYRLGRSACAPLLRSVFGLEVSGLERLPARGPFILAANHNNYLDGVVLGVAVPRPIAFLVMPRVYRASPLHPAFHRRIGSIPINLARPDLGAIRRAIGVLDQGGIVGIFPEGPFSHEGRLVQGQPGTAVLALRSGVPVVPAAIDGTYQALFGRHFHIPRPYPLRVRFGHPLSFANGGHRSGTHALRAEVTRRIMSEIAALLPGSPPDGSGAEVR